MALPFNFCTRNVRAQKHLILCLTLAKGVTVVRPTYTLWIWREGKEEGRRLRHADSGKAVFLKDWDWGGVFSSPFAEMVIGLGLKTNWEFIWWPMSVILTNQKAEAGLQRKLCLSAIVSLPLKFKTKQNTKASSLGEAQWQTPCLAWVSHWLPPPAAWKKRKITAKEDLQC